ncbi:MAG TPA: hypothetical protein VF070_49240 [Streptosporangiaceae bacterium]
MPVVCWEVRRRGGGADHRRRAARAVHDQSRSPRVCRAALLDVLGNETGFVMQVIAVTSGIAFGMGPGT